MNTTSTTHELKTLPRFFQPVWEGRKTFDLRRDDRGGFKVGDLLFLREYLPSTDLDRLMRPGCIGYTGREMTVEVTFVLTSYPGVAKGYACLGIKRLQRSGRVRPVTA